MKNKIVNQKALSSIAASCRRKNLKVVFTNGCFDILHVGHIEYLSKAKRLGDMLIIGLNSDRSVRCLKGKGRPVNKEADRAKILSALYFVDYITIFDSATPEKLIRSIKPDILVKGGDWKGKPIAGGEFVRGLGGRVVTIPFVKGYSTTTLIDRMAG